MNVIIGVVGSRRRDSDIDFKLVEEAFLKVYDKGDIICSGLCSKGADRFAVILQQKYEIPFIWYPAEWEKYGKKAGFKRNTDIAEQSDILIACVASDRTGGTEDTIKKFEKIHKRKAIIV